MMSLCFCRSVAPFEASKKYSVTVGWLLLGPVHLLLFYWRFDLILPKVSEIVTIKYSRNVGERNCWRYSNNISLKEFIYFSVLFSKSVDCWRSMVGRFPPISSFALLTLICIFMSRLHPLKTMKLLNKTRLILKARRGKNQPRLLNLPRRNQNYTMEKLL